MGNDLPVAARVGGETAARDHAILVDHAQHRTVLVIRVMVVGKREAVVGIEPAMHGVAVVFAPAQAKRPSFFSNKFRCIYSYYLKVCMQYMLELHGMKANTSAEVVRKY